MPNYIPSLEEDIRRLRANMLVHSYIYYQLNDNIIDDHEWQRRANRLVELQEKIKLIGFYDEAFHNWDASTGYHLPKDPWIHWKSVWLINERDKKRS